MVDTRRRFVLSCVAQTRQSFPTTRRLTMRWAGNQVVVRSDEQAGIACWPPNGEIAGPVVQFLRRCGSRDLPAATRTQLYDLGSAMSLGEWQSLRARARIEGMEALLLAHAVDAGLLPVMPEEVAETLLAVYRRQWIWNRRLRGEQRRIIAALSAHGVEVMVIKGVTLAERLYGDVALRPSGDIDLLVRPKDIESCARVLTMIGYAPLPGRATPSQWHAMVNRALAFRHSDGFELDVHWRLTSQPAYIAAFPTGEIWQSAEQADQADPSLFRRLSLDDELRFLCYHYAAQHEDKRLIWLVDIAEILRTLPAAWDWRSFAADTIARGLATPVNVALRTAQSVSELAAPRGLLETLSEATANPHEQRAWRTAQAHHRGLWLMYEHLNAQDSLGRRLVFTWQGFLWHGAFPALHRLSAPRRGG